MLEEKKVSPKFEVCENCGKAEDFKYRHTHLQLIEGKVWLCKKCAVEYQGNWRPKFSPIKPNVRKFLRSQPQTKPTQSKQPTISQCHCGGNIVCQSGLDPRYTNRTWIRESRCNKCGTLFDREEPEVL